MITLEPKEQASKLKEVEKLPLKAENLLSRERVKSLLLFLTLSDFPKCSFFRQIYFFKEHFLSKADRQTDRETDRETDRQKEARS